ncbi:hypothetical protein C2G38_946103 [Gigaspora rosea]|uniref:Uncharacterized protein n=1 Tax=Gigaspora rosea TaxID=44941 RepID=A0A397VLS6_9GLOM|nr:hypothetical protein C2G38_946103 [Gigaspora rosea]
MIIEKLFPKYRKIEPTSLFVLRIFVLILLLIAILEYTWVMIWGIYNDNPILQHSLEEGSYILFQVARFNFNVNKKLDQDAKCFDFAVFASYTFQQINISCHFVNVSGVHDCNQYIRYQYITDTRAYGGIFSTDDLIFSAVPNNEISSLVFKLYLNDTSFNMNLYKPYLYINLVEADFLKNYKNKGSNDLTVNDLFHDPFQNHSLTYSKFAATAQLLNLYQLAVNSVNIHNI